MKKPIHVWKAWAVVIDGHVEDVCWPKAKAIDEARKTWIDRVGDEIGRNRIKVVRVRIEEVGRKLLKGEAK